MYQPRFDLFKNGCNFSINGMSFSTSGYASTIRGINISGYASTSTITIIGSNGALWRSLDHGLNPQRRKGERVVAWGLGH
jgi:hypothetical protein